MAGFNPTNTFIVKVEHKRIVFVRTDTDRFFQIAHHQLIIDGSGDGNDGLIPKAEPISKEHLADLLAKYGVETSPCFGIKGKAPMKKRRLLSSQKKPKKEEVAFDA